ncbi:uncharacterized protein LOC126774922 [Nymphalis io]|uniref:uncharacterized protein LOC126774922 n=1 Tax=Inachis io TaxID=171585 RepID=UPI0021698DE0|nr:uncharacterized protein LOC126774922 [Nymphalis io]
MRRDSNGAGVCIAQITDVKPTAAPRANCGARREPGGRRTRRGPSPLPPASCSRSRHMSSLLTRSWEKRQGKLSNGYVVGRTDKTGTFLDITTIEQIVRIVSLKSDSSPPEPTKTINQAQRTVEKPTFSKLNSAKIDKLFQKKKSSDNERSASLNKKPPSKLHKNDLKII